MSEKLNVKVGDLYKCVNKKVRRFRQLQAIENAIANNAMIAGQLNDALRAANLLDHGEHAVHIVRDIRSEEYERVTSAKAAVDDIDAGPLPDITVTTHHGPINLIEPFMYERFIQGPYTYGPSGGDT